MSVSVCTCVNVPRLYTTIYATNLSQRPLRSLSPKMLGPCSSACFCPEGIGSRLSQTHKRHLKVFSAEEECRRHHLLAHFLVSHVRDPDTRYLTTLATLQERIRDGTCLGIRSCASPVPPQIHSLFARILPLAPAGDALLLWRDRTTRIQTKSHPCLA